MQATIPKEFQIWKKAANLQNTEIETIKLSSVRKFNVFLKKMIKKQNTEKSGNSVGLTQIFVV